MRSVFCTIGFILAFMPVIAQTDGQKDFMTIQDAMSIVSYRRHHPFTNDNEFDGFVKSLMAQYDYRAEDFLEGIGTCSFWQYIKHGHTVDTEPLDDDRFVPDDIAKAGTVAIIDCGGIETIEYDETAISAEIRVFSEASHDKILEEMRSIGFQYKKTENNIREYVYQSYNINVWNGRTRGHRMWQFTVQLNPRDFGTTKLYEFADSSMTHNLRIKVDYPVKGSPVMLRRVRTFIMEVLELDLYNDWPMARYNGDVSNGQALVNDYGRRGSVLLKEKHASEMSAFEESTNIKKVAENDYFISFEVDKYGWYGGATSGSVRAQLYGVTFRKSDGKRLHVIANPHSPQLRDFMSNQMYIEDQGVRYDENKNNIPFPKYEPFLIQTGVRFIYQKYEIAPCSCVGDAPFSGIKQFLGDEVLEVLK